MWHFQEAPAGFQCWWPSEHTEDKCIRKKKFFFNPGTILHGVKIVSSNLRIFYLLILHSRARVVVEFYFVMDGITSVLKTF